jgi:hypothetical protein
VEIGNEDVPTAVKRLLGFPPVKGQ